LEARNAQGTWRLGNRAFALGGAAGTDSSPEYSEVVLSLDYVSCDAFRFEDMPRPAAAATVAKLVEAGIGSTVLSGDRQGVVRRLAASLGIASWQADLNPVGKVKALEDMRGRGLKVLMVGDGINDAPALRTAHVSMAPSTAADVGRQAADFVFMREGLDAVTTAVAVSRQAGRLIRENFALAIGYNMIAVPVAILGYATPLIAAIAMSTSSLIVVANSLRLNALAGEAPEDNPLTQPKLEVRPI
jgi:Cu2+-exporting ATPase